MGNTRAEGSSNVLRLASSRGDGGRFVCVRNEGFERKISSSSIRPWSIGNAQLWQTAIGTLGLREGIAIRNCPSLKKKNNKRKERKKERKKEEEFKRQKTRQMRIAFTYDEGNMGVAGITNEQLALAIWAGQQHRMLSHRRALDWPWKLRQLGTLLPRALHYCHGQGWMTRRYAWSSVIFWRAAKVNNNR